MKMRMPILCALVFATSGWDVLPAQTQPTREQASQGLRRAVEFFRANCAAEGGYVFRVSDDLTLREGESKVGHSTAWIEPPATPAVGAAYLDAYQRTQDPLLLEAARETATALIRGQLVSGGWYEYIEFDADERKRHAYRADGGEVGKRRNTTTFDDNKTQSAIRFLMRLDTQLGQSDAILHEAVVYALDSVLRAQFANGAWPQKSDGSQPADVPIGLPASYPESWSREFPNQKYTGFYTLNDGTLCDLIAVQLDAWDTYRDTRFLESAKKAGQFLLDAQMPDPQPGWSQQYGADMHPMWARKFEPPAITGGESQRVMRSLLELYQRTADRRYLEAVSRALEYYRSCELPNGRLARFYELRTNRPLYFTKTYELTYSAEDLPTHYGFQVPSNLNRITRDLQRLAKTPTDRLHAPVVLNQAATLTQELADQAAAVLAALDARGAWVEPGKMREYDSPQVTKIISSATFIKNLETLAEFIQSR